MAHSPPDPARYPLIEDHALIGDGGTAALVATDATVDWLCLPRFDGPALFASLLDAERGGRWTLEVAGLGATLQEYLPGTAVVRTTLSAPGGGVVEVLDALPLSGNLRIDTAVGTGELVRLVRVVAGEVDLRTRLQGRGGLQASGGVDDVEVRWQGADRPLRLHATAPVEGLERLDGHIRLHAGDRLGLVLHWGEGPSALRNTDDIEAAMDRTALAWRTWVAGVDYEGPHAELVRRSAITLKLCDHHANGALVASPTSSLPEAIGGSRNWDYRFTWVRDAAFSVYALRRIGLVQEAESFLRWVLDAYDRDNRPHLLYAVDATQPAPEQIDPELRGYRDSPPVRWGNGAAEQIQHDVYGEILDCAWQWAHHGGRIEDQRWDRLRSLAVLAQEHWRDPDQGIWEIRHPGRLFTYSVAMCQVAADRTARLAELTGRGTQPGHWRQLAETIRTTLLAQAYNPGAGHFTEHLGDGPATVDASLLALPLRRVVAASDPRMQATVGAVSRRLGVGGGLLYRYLPADSSDGLEGEEGAFLLCSFWWADNLIASGHLDQGQALFDSLCARVNHVGLLPEQIDPGTGAFLGNFPQAFSHIGLISTAVNLSRHLSERDT